MNADQQDSLGAHREQGLRRLRTIFAPEIVGVPPTNAIHELMVLPDGEIRHYGFEGDFKSGDVVRVCHSSPDHGFSWIRRHDAPHSPGATTRSPWSGDYLTLLCTHGHPCLEEFQGIHELIKEPGLYVHRSRTGPDGPFVSTRVGDLLPRMITPRQPLPLRHRRRWVMPAHAAATTGNLHLQQPVVYLSDDDGESWRMTALPPIPRKPFAWPHKGPRWHNCGDEPTIAELSDGRLYMLIRTSHDQYWESWSTDGGETWSESAPSRFHGTITTPLLFGLSDGRLLAVFNNTTPLPEADHAEQTGLGDDERAGVCEDLFTNRDAIHAAISDDDGATWRGFRELHLNERRNDSDFRSRGGNDHSLDKSVHQSQAVELPLGRVLLSFGQHPDCRRMVVFDPDWLLETERRDDFRLGLGGWSVHSYLKGIAGGYRGVTGHCSLNRRPGPALVPHPGGEPREVLRVARHADDRLMEEREGAVWNFPAGSRGVLRVGFRLPSGSRGAKISLLDRWFNPTDILAAHFAQFVIEIDATGLINGRADLRHDRRHELVVRWNLDARPAGGFSIDGGASHPLTLANPTQNGVSYVHFQSAADQADHAGILVECVEKTLD
jgi:hypothetical protein